MKSRSWRSIFRLPVFPAAKKRVAIVVPISTRPELTEGEQTSLRHLQHFLGRYDIYFVAPPDVSPELPNDAKVIRFPAKYFGSNHAHSLMQLTAEFYEQFLEYEYILMYHLDALAFSDDLEQWCSKGLDYIGAPWLKNHHTPWVEEPEVGNSGFALMNVRSFLRVLYSRRRRYKMTMSYDNTEGHRPNPFKRVLLAMKSLRYLIYIRNDVRNHIRYMLNNEQLSDLFWSRYARHYYPDFKIGSLDQAMTFAFETDPKGCLEKTSGKLPFGCHAWEKFDPGFWEPYLLQADQAD